MNATAATIDAAPRLRPIRSDRSPLLGRAGVQVAELYRLMPEYHPERAGPLTLCGLAMRSLESAVRDCDWSMAGVSLAVLADVYAALAGQEDITGLLAEVLDATHDHYRGAVRELCRDQYESRRAAYRSGVNEGQRSFCEDRRPRRMKE